MYVLKVPYDNGGGMKSYGAKYGPDAIEHEFKSRPWRCAEDGAPHQEVDFIRITASEQDNSRDRILGAYGTWAGSLLDSGERSFFALTGDNSCSFHTVKAVARRFPDVQLALLDAHMDACDEKHDPHANWVRKLWDDGALNPESTFFFGIRDPEENEIAYVREKGAFVASAAYLDENGVDAVRSRLVFSRMINVCAPIVFVVDIDVLDPSFAPGTGVLRAGGLSVRQVLRLTRLFGSFKFPIKIGEISEVISAGGDFFRSTYDKRPDPCGLTVIAADAILREMIKSFA